MKKWSRRTIKRWLIIPLSALCAVAVLYILGSLFYSYSRGQIYRESVSQLEELSAQLFEKLDVQVDLQWGYLDKMDELRADSDSMTGEEFTEYITLCERLLGPAGKTIYFRALDEDGRYYTHDGRYGIWTGLDRIDFDADRQSLIIANWPDTTNYMAFVQKLTTPLEVDGQEITHFILLRSMEDMQPFFHSSAFGENNMIYIIDREGLITFKNGTLSGIDFEGLNIFNSLKDAVFPHDGDLETVLAHADENDRDCTDVEIAGHDYYLIYELLPRYEWGVLMLVSAGDVAVTTTSMVDAMLTLFSAIIIALMVLMAVSFLFIARFRDNQALLAVKEESERQLQNSYRLLENANEDLQKAQKETEDALEVANRATKAKSRFLANMSHDIRTPMNAIVGITKLMEAEVDDREKMPYYIRKLQTSSSYMLGLINDILDMSKIESGEVHLNPESVSLPEQVGQIESIIRSQSNEKNQEFTIAAYGVRHEYLIGDSVRLRQVFINLLNNAVKYTQSGGSIRMELRELPCADPDCATLRTSVIDNGYGMSAEFLTRIFEPFSRAEDSMTNRIQGTGLGMSITKSIVDMMGGTITVESELGRGSRFDVTLTFPIDRTAVHDAGLRSLMLITSDETLQENVRAALAEEHVELRIAACMRDAVRELRERPADAVLLSGFLQRDRLSQAVRELREAGSPSPVILCCDYARREQVSMMLRESGVDGFIARPFFFANLLRALEQMRSDENKSRENRSPLAGMHFLCAEDNELNAEILEALLDMHHATCKIYPGGLEIVEAFASVKPGDYDAILMDVQMPGMNGMDATRAIRQGSNPLGRTIPIIAMTANAFSSDVQDCLDAGMDAHLAKPLDISMLERTLHDIKSVKSSGGGTAVRPEKTHPQSVSNRQ